MFGVVSRELALGALLLAGCGGPTILPVKEGKKCEIQVVSLAVVASPLINPTLEAEARPVQMRIYQLKDDVRLQAATFEQIWKEDATVLGPDVIKRDEVFVYPNTRTDVKFDRDPAASFIVGAALFRNPKGRSWYVSFELPPAPGKGDCLTPGNPACEDGKCGTNANPKFSMWVDGTRVDDGADHLGDVTDGRRIRIVTLSKPVPEPAPSSSAATKAPSEAKQP
ncbi:MAG: Type secretion lipoprotein/VasD [Myxococcaceae bacterium]|jgi:type VI secretion system protein VasD|nr:Type secretion lipoprotein/VasD [Myxococcaceae bacterium]MEA2749126.1 type secretion system protein VasD [Myxococcales bacterium]